jgi:asparagine synthase (glutamine-hydrolysing)
MCGIFSIFENQFESKVVETAFAMGKQRGPEFSKLLEFQNTVLGFHRLAINGLDDASNQPFLIDNIVLICNGEIYNYKQLLNDNSIVPQTNSDCEVIIHMYLLYGIQCTLSALDGVFAFVLLDLNINKAFIARDPFGVRPLYLLKGKSIAFASEIKSLIDLHSDSTIQHFKPGTYTEIALQESKIINLRENITYFTLLPPCSFIGDLSDYNILHTLHRTLTKSVEKRVLNSDRPIACLLSGGLDSSLITTLVNKLSQPFRTTPLETYSIGIEGSEDVINARVVASFLKTNHHEIILSEDDFFDAIPEVIFKIESYDVTTVRASIGNYLLAKYIANHSDAKVIFNGDGSDELFGGYLYMKKSPDPYEFDKETRRLLDDIHMFDVLRSDKSISSNGLEPRTPFLDKNLVQFYMSLPNKVKFHYHKKGGKYMLRKAFENDELLPESILWRKKEAFSDGVSKQDRSLFHIIQEKIQQTTSTNVTGIELEKQYYKKLYDQFYPYTKNVITHYWMPKYTDTTDPSARTISAYHE